MRKRIQSFDARFTQNQRDQFRKPTTKTCQDVKLRVNGKTTSDHDTVVQTWVDHFKDIRKYRADEKASVASANSEMQGLMTESFVNVEAILDVPFAAEEIEAAIKCLKAVRLTVWLMQICIYTLDAAKCLGFWWSWNLAAKIAVDEAVKKARHAFFLFGRMVAFQGD